MVVGTVLAAIAAPAYGAGAFTDDDGNIHEANIDFIASLGITKGCNPPTNDHYCPDRNVTRAEMATFLRRAFDVVSSSLDPFIDDDASVHEGDINAIAAASITKGCNPPANDRYCPDRYVTRAEMATFIIRGLGDVAPFRAPIFIDVARSDTHAANINALAGLGITKGCNPPVNDQYCPDRYVTRAEMASFLARMIRLGDRRPPAVQITAPPNLATFITNPDPDTALFASEVTFRAFATDPDGDAITSYRWDSSVAGVLGTSNPLAVTLAIPAGQTSSQPHISVVVTDSTGMFSGGEVQIKLILPSPT